MMRQSINFLKVLPKNSSRLSVLHMGWILIGSFCFLLIISITYGVQQYNAHRALSAANTALLQAQQVYDTLAKAYPLLASDAPLVNQVKALEQQVHVKQEEYNLLEHLTVRHGFSDYMSGLAQTVPASLWFNQILINEETGSVTLLGYAVHPDDVSLLMSRLIHAPAYTETIFNLFYVKAVKNHSYVKFSIATDDLGSEEEKDAQAINEPKR